MGKINFHRDRGALSNSPLILRQLAKNKTQLNSKLYKVIPTKSNKTKSVKTCEGNNTSRKRKNESEAEVQPKKAKVDFPQQEQSIHAPDNTENEKVIEEVEVESTSSTPRDHYKPEIIAVNGNRLEAVEECGGVRYLKYLGSEEEVDIFLTEESKSSNEELKFINLYYLVIDEVALEGLDGITFEALWTRLQRSQQLPFILHETVKELLWRMLCYVEAIEIYILAEPRGKLLVYDRYQYLDASDGVIREPTVVGENEIYPYCLVSDSEKKVRGSCSTYYSRMEAPSDIKKLSYKEVSDQYGMRLVLVGNQNLRNHALSYEMTDPRIVWLDGSYMILERVGRSRRHGELTQGNHSLQELCLKDAKLLFYNIKRLKKGNMVTKQFYYIKTRQTEQTLTGAIVHLTRFYNRRKTKYMAMTQHIFNAIKEKPNFKMDLDEFRRRFGHSISLKQLLKHTEFNKFIKCDNVCRYREIYPDARKGEWQMKANKKEKLLRVLEPVDPHSNVEANWLHEDSSDDEESSDEDMVKLSMNREYSQDVYKYILSQGPQGATVADIRKHKETDFYSCRACLRKLVDKKAIGMNKVDQGRQRICRYYATCFENLNEPISLQPKPMKLEESILSKIKNKMMSQVTSNDFASEDEEDNMDTSDSKTPYNSKSYQLEKFKCAGLVKKSIESIIVEIMEVSVKLSLDMKWKSPTLPLKLPSQLVFKGSLSVSFKLPFFSDNLISHGFYSCQDENLYYQQSSYDKATKLLLIKLSEDDQEPADIEAMIEKLEYKLNTNAETQIIQTCSEEIIEEDKSDALPDPRNFFNHEQVILLDETDEHDIRTRIFVSKSPGYFMAPGSKFNPKNKLYTERVMKRVDLILGVLNSQEVFENVYKLKKVIDEVESQSGFKDVICRRSLRRIITMLIKEGYVRMYKLYMTVNKYTRLLTFMVMPFVCTDHHVIVQARERMKMQFFLSKPYINSHFAKLKPSLSNQSTLSDSNKTLRYWKPPYQSNPRAARRYGFKPKFIRMQVLHEFLYFLAYENNNSRELTIEETTSLLDSFKIQTSPDIIQNLPKIYNTEISWKMFVPPLPSYSGWGTGWMLICDMLIRLPLSVFVKIFSIVYDIPELETYLNHRIKRHFPVKYLPENIRHTLFYKRKYIFDAHEIVSKMCFVGLVQFGPQRNKEKDQVFIFINKKASLLDTTTSDVDYNMVTDKHYERVNFTFTSSVDVEDYWRTVWTISMGTPLGKREFHDRECIIVEEANAKAALIEALQPREPPDVAYHLDCGHMPGDKRGAAGYDSALWVHLKRNWFWIAHEDTKQIVCSVADLHKERVDKVPPEPVTFDSLTQNYCRPSKIVISKRSVKESDAKLNKPAKISKNGKSIRRKKKGKRIIRVIPKTKKINRQYYDALDRAISREYGFKVRRDWSEKELKMLKLLKAVSIYLNPCLKKYLLPSTTFRDVLHRLVPESRDKTSKSVKRKLDGFQKSEKEMRDIDQWVENLSNLTVCQQYFNQMRLNLNKNGGASSKKTMDQSVNVAFIYLVGYIVTNYQELKPMIQFQSRPWDYFSPHNIERYKKKLAYVEKQYICKYTEPENIEEIKVDVVRSVIHSTLAYKQDEAGWPYQLFSIYQKFTDQTIRTAILWLRKQQLIASKKKFGSKRKPLTHAPFQLSNLYIYVQSSTFTCFTAIEANRRLKLLYSGDNSAQDLVCLGEKRYGSLLGYCEIASLQDITLKFHVPETPFILNTDLEDHSEVIKELAYRYQLYLKEKLEDENFDKLNFGDGMSLEQTFDGSEERNTNNIKTEPGLIPSLEEIMEGMMEPLMSKERKIPYITDLTALFSKERFPNLINDDETLYRWRKHFLMCFPTLTNFSVKDVENFRKNEHVKFVFSTESDKLLQEVHNSLIVKPPIDDVLEKTVRKERGTDADIALTKEILNFIESKEALGASGPELKDKFATKCNNLPLHVLLQLMIQARVLLRAGVTRLVFVHHKYKSLWLVESFAKPENEDDIHLASEQEARALGEKMVSQGIKFSKEILVNVMPWTKVDGTLNKELFVKWVCTVLSYCLENPGVPFNNLSKRFCYLKSTDLYYILEYLQKVGSISIMAYEYQEVTLFSVPTIPAEHPASLLDRFEDMFVEINPMPMVRLGAGLAADNMQLV